jgi:single-stranded DNA-binding protein
MNIVVLAGRIVRDASVKGVERKVLRFTVETRDGHDEGENKERINQVPCVLFGPSPELEQVLITSGEGRQVELQGRIASWNGEGNGRPQVEVVVFKSSLTFAKES